VSVKALFVLPLATAGAPAWLHLALETRLLATITRSCPCGATYDPAELRPGEVHTPAMWHEAHCPAADPRLQSAAVLPDWIELRVIVVELADEAAA
jgi:hypothetical protein